MYIKLAEGFAYTRYFYLIKKFYRKQGYWPKVAIPGNFAEKALWRKIFDHNPVFAALSDKLGAKKHFLTCCPEINVVEPLWVGKRPEDIPDEVLAGDCVVKTNFGSGHNIFIHGGRYDRAALVRLVSRWLRKGYGASKGEWAYARITPRIFVEPMIKPRNPLGLLNVLFETFSGHPRVALIHSDKQIERRKHGFFDLAGNRLAVRDLNFLADDQAWPDDFSPPVCFREAAQYAARLAAGIDYCRVDFMCADEKLYGLEMTFYSGSGWRRYTDPNHLVRLGRYWDLRKSWFLTAPQRGWRAAYARQLRERLSAAPLEEAVSA